MRMWGEGIVEGERSSIGQRVDQYRWKLGAIVVPPRSTSGHGAKLYSFACTFLCLDPLDACSCLLIATLPRLEHL